MPAIDRSTVSLRFSGEGLDPNELENLLEVFHSEAAAKPIVKQRGDIVIWSVGCSESDSIDLGQKIEGLLNLFSKDTFVWKDISKKFRGEIFCGLFLDGWNRGFEFPTDLLRDLSERNLSISFDIYSPTNTWEE